MVDQIKAIQAVLIQMIRGKMSARQSQRNAAELSLETPLEDLRLDYGVMGQTRKAYNPKTPYRGADPT
jgi:hypothetical protein